MRKKLMWIAAALVLIALPAVVGLVVIQGDDSSSRRAAALVEAGTGGGYQLVVSGLTPAGKAADILSYSWGVTNNATFSTGGLTAGRAQFADLQVTKKLDMSSPLFVKGAAQGVSYPSATLTIYKSGEKGAVDYAIYQMTNVMVTAVQHSGTADDVPTEQITLAYSKLQVTVKDLDETGAAKGQTTFTYDLAAAKAG